MPRALAVVRDGVEPVGTRDAVRLAHADARHCRAAARDDVDVEEARGLQHDDELARAGAHAVERERRVPVVG